MDARSLWGQVAERAQALLSGSVEARVLLGNNGVTEEVVWSHYRLGATGPALLEAFSAAERERLIAQGLHTIRGGSPLRNPGILVPTFDPSAPHTPVGFVKLAPAQNKHAFIGTPQGLACPSDLAEPELLVVADAPLLMLRLAQAGVRDVVLAETPDVLPPLAEWLRARRRIVLASYKKAGLAALSEALQALGVKSTQACIGLELARTGKATLALLGIDRSAVAVPKAEPAPLTSKVLSDLVSFAQGRIGTSEARGLLETLHAEDTRLIEAFGVGYLPSDYHRALPKDLRPTLKRRLVAHSLVVPALDDVGAVVDLLLVRLPNAKHPQFNLKDTPEGLVGARVARIHDDVLVTDSFRVLARLWTAGRENVLLLRDASDARLNAQRLAAYGVVKATVCTRRYMDSDGIAEALKSEGLAVSYLPLPKTLDGITSALFEQPVKTVTPRRKAKPVQIKLPAPEAPAPLPAQPEAGRESCAPPALGSEAPAVADPVLPTATVAPAAPSGLVLVGHDAAAELATYREGEALYKIETSADAGSRLELRLEHRGKFHLDRFDLAVERQRRCFAMSAALRTGVPFEAIQEHLLQLLDGVRSLRETSHGCARRDDDAKASMSDAERAEALALLRRPELLDLLASDLEALGWVGEERNKRLLFLIALSRKLSNPLYGALRAVLGSGKSYEMGLIARLTPPEDLIQVTRLSDAALYHADPGALKRRLLVLDEADALTPEVLNALRVLHTRGALSKQITEYDALQQRHRTRTVEVEGPLAVLTSTTTSLEEQFLSRCFELAVDDSPEQTRRILEAQRHRRALAEGQDGEPGSRIVRRCRNLQRLLEPLTVSIPFAGRIVFPDSSVRYRRAQERFLTLIEASALLHQHQRLKDAGRIVATEADFAVAVLLAGDAVEHAADELSANARDVLGLIDTETLRSFTVQRIQALRPGWTRHKLRSGLAELEQYEFVAGVGRTKPRQYRRIATATLAASSAPALRATGGIGALAEIGEAISPMQKQA